MKGKVFITIHFSSYFSRILFGSIFKFRITHQQTVKIWSNWLQNSKNTNLFSINTNFNFGSAGVLEMKFQKIKENNVLSYYSNGLKSLAKFLAKIRCCSFSRFHSCPFELQNYKSFGIFCTGNPKFLEIWTSENSSFLNSKISESFMHIQSPISM